MSILRTIPEDEATGLVAELYAEDIADLGYVPSYTKAMALNPEAVTAFSALASAIARPLGMRNYELVTLASAEALGSDMCRLAHSRKSLKYMDAEEVVAIARDYRSAGLSDTEVAMMDFAAKLSRDAESMTEADSLRLRELGFSDAQIVNITLAAGLRNLYSRSLHALAVELDVPPGLPDGVVEAIRG
ncbi:carboxymuconolactone decarboxylase family protein [Schumannella luteola]